MGSQKSKRLTGKHPLAYTGVEPITPPLLAIENRVPIAHDVANYNIGALWVVRNDSLEKAIYMLIDKQNKAAEWVKIYPVSDMPLGGLDGEVLIGDTGDDPVWSEITSNNGSINIVGGPGTIDLSINGGLDGEVLIGYTGADPVWSEIASSNGSISIVGGPGTIDITLSNDPTFDADTGTAIPTLGALNILGGAGIVTSAATDTVMISSQCANEFKTDFGSVSIQLHDPNWIKVTGLSTASGVTSYPTPNNNLHTYAGATGGGLNVALNKFIEWPDSIVTTLGLIGSIWLNGETFMHNFGTNSTWLGKSAGSHVSTTANRNTGIGYGCMSGVTTGEYNTACGSGALSDLTTGTYNTSVGRNSMNDIIGGSSNVALGHKALGNATSASYNVAIGDSALVGVGSSKYNIGIGYLGGSLTTGNSNIVIGTVGVGSESHHIRIGTHGTGTGEQDSCTIAGINNNGLQATSKKLVFIDAQHDLGTGVSYTSGYVTTNGSGIVSIKNPLTLPEYAPGVLRSDGTTAAWSNSASPGRVLITGNDGTDSYPKWRAITPGVGTSIVESNWSITIGSSNPVAQPPAFMWAQDGDIANVTGDGTFYQLGSTKDLTKRHDTYNNMTKDGVFTAPYNGIYHISMHVTYYGIPAIPDAPPGCNDPLRIDTTLQDMEMMGLSIIYLETSTNTQSFQLDVDMYMIAGNQARFKAAVLHPAPYNVKNTGIQGKSSSTSNRERTWVSGFLVSYT